MKKTITETVRVKRVIDVEYPYYFTHDLDSEYSDSVIYGKISEDGSAVMIHESIKYDESEISYEISSAYIDDSYYREEYKAAEPHFIAAKERMMKFFERF